MKKSKWFNKQYILLSVSILLGLIVLIVGSSYAYYIVNITGNDDNNDVAVKTSNINLEISNVSGSLSLCKTYPISDTEGLSCTPYQFTLTNNTKTDLEYYLNLEYQTSAPEDTIKVAFATCDDENCTNPNYAISKLSEILDNNDTISSKYTGKLLTSGKIFGTGTSNKKTYSIILWIDSDSTYEDDTFNASISAITYTQTQDILSYTLSFDLENKATWTTDTCKSSDGYTINGTKCEKTIGVNESYGNLPSVTINGEDALWYSDNKLFNNKATTDTKYTMRQNTIYKSITNSALASHTFNYTGEEQIFTASVAGKYKLETWGAQGGDSLKDVVNGGIGGYGGYSAGVLELEHNQKIYVNVGGKGNTVTTPDTRINGGYNGGGAAVSADSYGTNAMGSGGGATHIATESGLLSIFNSNINALLIVAGGGGGSSYYRNSDAYYHYGFGGSAGGYIGGKSYNYYSSTIENMQANGGGQELSTISNSSNYNIGTFGKGSDATVYGSGGGGGYYGGDHVIVQGSGGGSGYIGNSLLIGKYMYCYNCTTSDVESTKTYTTTCAEETPTENCAKIGNGYARITLIS